MRFNMICQANDIDTSSLSRTIRFRTLSGLTPYEYIVKIGISELHRFIVDPIHQTPGLNT